MDRGDYDDLQQLGRDILKKKIRIFRNGEAISYTPKFSEKNKEEIPWITVYTDH